jgi:hypothetical protein
MDQLRDVAHTRSVGVGSKYVRAVECAARHRKNSSGETNPLPSASAMSKISRSAPASALFRTSFGTAPTNSSKLSIESPSKSASWKPIARACRKRGFSRCRMTKVLAFVSRYVGDFHKERFLSRSTGDEHLAAAWCFSFVEVRACLPR